VCRFGTAVFCQTLNAALFFFLGKVKGLGLLRRVGEEDEAVDGNDDGDNTWLSATLQTSKRDKN
jgi:hypothetical protein